MTQNGLIVSLMAVLFLTFGYLGVPVAFSLIAGVVIGTLFTPVSLPSIIAQLFNGIDVEPLMAVPFFLLVGELMTSANVVVRIANLSQALVGHVRGGLAQVVTVFSMFFSGMSGSSLTTNFRRGCANLSRRGSSTGRAFSAPRCGLLM